MEVEFGNVCVLASRFSPNLVMVEMTLLILRWSPNIVYTFWIILKSEFKTKLTNCAPSSLHCSVKI
jgi:hypothetical protein